MSQIEPLSEHLSRHSLAQLPILSSTIPVSDYLPEVRIMDGMPSSPADQKMQHEALDEIERNLLKIGIPPHIKGFPYIRDAVAMLLESEEKIFGITKVLYPDIARLHDTTSTRVERAIRHAIELIWSRRESGVINVFAGRKAKPSNAEFLAYVSRSIMLNMLP